MAINLDSLAARLGGSLGTGLSQSLEGLVSGKLSQLEQRNQAEGIRALMPQFTPEQAQAFVQQAPEIQKQLLSIPQQESYAQALNQIIGGEASPLPSGARLNEKQFTQLAKLGLQKQQLEATQQEKLEPFLKGQAEDYTNAKKLYSKAKSMLENIKKNRRKFPGVLSGNIIPEKFRTDPDIRKYVADANTLVTLLAGSRKGQPTNFKVKLEQMSKPNLGQPIESQIALLEDIIKDSESVFKTQKKLSDIKQEHGGKYPRDLRQRLIEGELEAPESSQQSEYMGDIVQDDEGNILKWDASKGQYRVAKQRV